MADQTSFEEALTSPAGVLLGANDKHFPELLEAYCAGAMYKENISVRVYAINGKEKGDLFFGYFISADKPRSKEHGSIKLLCKREIVNEHVAFRVSSSTLDSNNTLLILGEDKQEEQQFYKYVVASVQAIKWDLPKPGVSYGSVCSAVALGSKATAKRPHWKGFIFVVPGSKFKVNRPPLLGLFPEGTPIEYRPHVDRVFDDGTVGVYFPSDEDFSATDWIITVPEKIEPADGQIEMDF